MNTAAKTNANNDTVYFSNGSKAGVAIKEGSGWVAYSLSDLETYSGASYLEACWSLTDGE